METLIEKTKVQHVYNEIANEFDNSRFIVWKYVKDFLDKIPVKSTVLEVGCGNGKNMLYRTDIDITGVDFSDAFVNICLNKKLNVIKANCLDLPFADSTFDYCISIAVIHHLETKERRLQAIKEMIRVTKPKGKIMIQVWAFRQLENSKRIFEKCGDNLVGWKQKNGDELFRYYYIFDDNELKEYLKEITYVKINEYGIPIYHSNKIEDNYYYDNGNWIIEFTV